MDKLAKKLLSCCTQVGGYISEKGPINLIRKPSFQCPLIIFFDKKWKASSLLSLAWKRRGKKIGSFNVAHPSLSFILDVIIHENGMHLSRNSTTTYLAPLRLIATLMRFPMGLCTHHQRKSSEKFEKIDYVICISNRA